MAEKKCFEILDGSKPISVPGQKQPAESGEVIEVSAKDAEVLAGDKSLMLKPISKTEYEKRKSGAPAVKGPSSTSASAAGSTKPEKEAKKEKAPEFK